MIGEPATMSSIGERPGCPACGMTGVILYDGLVDRLFGARGSWTMKRCPFPACGSLWLDPAPSSADLESAYATYYTHVVPEDVSGQPLRRAYAWFKEGYYGRRYDYPVSGLAGVKRALGLALYGYPPARDRLDMRIIYLPSKAGGRLLNVGCGNGSLLALMRAMGWQVEGVEMDAAAVGVTQSLGIPARVGSLQAQHYPEASFDAVMMSHVIEHVPDPLAVLSECHRIPRPGGRPAIETPNVASVGHARLGRDWRGLEPPRHLQLFTAASIEAMARRAGFGIERSVTSPRLAAMIRRESPRVGGTGVSLLMRLPDPLFMAATYLGWMLDRSSGEELALVATR